MALTDLVPWGRGGSMLAPRLFEERDPFLALHREMDRVFGDMDRMFDDFSRGFGIAPLGFSFSSAWPDIEVSETDKELKVEAELPGMDEKDIDVSLADGVLTIKGEKKAEGEAAFYSERWHGKFQRSVELGPDIDPEKARAAFKKGVLTVTVPKLPEAQSHVKHIPIGNA